MKPLDLAFMAFGAVLWIVGTIGGLAKEHPEVAAVLAVVAFFLIGRCN